ncbi:MAG: hypothetical protein PHH98_01810 [Candidatus Gracilibacteria bacterium]|nr:hypothetical protein [Candidatus Gracilibacteria bacterium]
MGKENLLSNVELPFFKILFNNSLFSEIEINKLHNFLEDIGLSEQDLNTYKELQNTDVSLIDREKVKSYHDNIRELFMTRKCFILAVIIKSIEFNEFINMIKIDSKSKEFTILEYVYEYIYFGLLSMVTNFETQRVSKGIFDIIKK